VVLTRLVVLMIEDRLQDIVYLLEEIWCHGEARSNQLCHDQLLKLNIEPWHKGFVKSYG
jgi:hypothetical protein